MDPVTIIVAAITLGAAAGLKDTTEKVIKDAYAGMKQIIIDRYHNAKIGVDLIESNPEQETFQETTTTLLQDSGAGKDEELLRQAQELTKLIEQYAPSTIAEVNISVADVRAMRDFKIEDITAKGSHTNVDVNVRNVDTGGGFLPNPSKRFNPAVQ